MRIAPLLAGSVLLLVGLAATGGGGMMKGAGDTCIQLRCDVDEAYAWGIVGYGILLGGALAGLAGTALLVAGTVAQGRARSVPVRGPERACPACGALGAVEARYCAACGVPVTPAKRA